MKDSKKRERIDFLVTFFIENRAVSRLLSDVVKNRENLLFSQSMGVPKDFVFPFYEEKDDNSNLIYVIKQGETEEYKAILLEKPCNGHEIKSGDYIFFENHNNKKIVKALFIATTHIFVAYKKYHLKKGTNIFIGRMPSNDISYTFSDYVAREKHIALRVDSEGNTYIEDLKRSVGVYVNGNLTHSKKLNVFDEVYLMGLSIIYMGDFIAVRNLKMKSTLLPLKDVAIKTPIGIEINREYFAGTPRIVKSLDKDEIDVDGPPNPPSKEKTPAILVIGPSLTMSLVMLANLGVSVSSAVSGGNLSSLITSGTMTVGMLLGSLMWPSLLRSYQKRSLIAQEKFRKDRYLVYIEEIEKKLAVKTKRTVRILNEILSPTPEILCALFDNESNKLRLWERSYEDKDFLSVRMGTGERPFDVQIKVPKQGFSLFEDEMRELPDKLKEKYGVLKNVPMILNLRTNKTIGIIGKKKNINNLLMEMILNILSLHSYDEVKIAFVVSDKQAAEFEMFKNVPHIWSDDKKVRYFATTKEEVHFIFNKINEVLKMRESSSFEKAAPIPHFVLMIMEPSLIEKETLLRYINDSENQVGLTTIFPYGTIKKLPKACKTIIQSDENQTGYYIKNQNENKFIPFSLDEIEERQVNAFAANLSKLLVKRDSRALGIAEQVSFLQMYKAGNIKELEIEAHWNNNNSAKSLAAPIGVMAGGEVFSLDIHEAYHGCHGLVAGTTGSGKSEFLQAFILSLAINYSPKEIAFVLVDFKGGDMMRPFMAKKSSPALPHLSATISNLSGNILYRALVSLGAEIKFRQRLFNESALKLGVDKLDINSYHKYYKSGRLTEPLPHLVIIIDEFAQLKTQQSDFLTELINVAQVGRSLGIHLILATQKPSGIVDPQIMSNSRFKVCLKVADKQDSVDMINKPDSAFIKNPGRLYLQVGYDEVYECIQSGYSGADYIPAKKYMPEEEITVHMVDHTANPIHSAKFDFSIEKTDKTELEAIVADIVQLGKQKNLYAKPLWLDMLPEKVIITSLEKGTKGLCTATLGLVDYVKIQTQKPLTIDFTKSGHIGIYGASGTGKTTFLQTLIYSLTAQYSYTPEELNIYAMDFGGRNLAYFDILPHTKAVVFADEEKKVVQLKEDLCEVLEERKQLFALRNCGTYEDYRKVCKEPLPAVLVLIDNFSSFREKYMDIADDLIEPIAAGKTFGIYFVITGNTKDSIYYRVVEHISTYFAFKMNDVNVYLDIFNKRPQVLPEDIRGRGIMAVGTDIVEVQVAVAFDGETEVECVSKIHDKYRHIAAAWEKTTLSVHKKHLESVDKKIGYTALKKESVPNEPSKQVYKSGEKTSKNSVAAIENTEKNLILGSSKSGMLQYGISLSDSFKVCIYADSNGQFSYYYEQLLRYIFEYDNREVVFIDSEEKNFENIARSFLTCQYIWNIDSLEQYIEQLKPVLNERLANAGKQSTDLFIVISNFNKFFDMITDEQAAFMRKVMKYINSPEYRIYFITGFCVNANKNNDGLFIDLIVQAKNYIVCPESYEKASSKVESLPFILNMESDACYFIKDDKNVEIRW